MRHLRHCRRARAASGVRPDFVRRLSGHALRFQVQPFAANSQLGVGWNTTRLHAKDYISSDPQNKAKSGRGDRGRRAATCELFEKHFGKKEP